MEQVYTILIIFVMTSAPILATQLSNKRHQSKRTWGLIEYKKNKQCKTCLTRGI